MHLIGGSVGAYVGYKAGVLEENIIKSFEADFNAYKAREEAGKV